MFFLSQSGQETGPESHPGCCAPDELEFSVSRKVFAVATTTKLCNLVAALEAYTVYYSL